MGCFSAALVLVVAFVAAVIKIKDWPLLWLLAWSLAVGWLSHQAASAIRRPGQLISTSWLTVILNAVTLFSVFTIGIYPR